MKKQIYLQPNYKKLSLRFRQLKPRIKYLLMKLKNLFFKEIFCNQKKTNIGMICKLYKNRALKKEIKEEEYDISKMSS